MENKIKLLFFIPTLENDGAERAMSNITTHLPDNVEADILLNSVSDHDFPTDANIISLGMRPGSNKGIMYQLEALFRRLPKLYQLKKNNHYDACISFMDSANMCNILTKTKKCKTVISVRTSVSRNKTFIYRNIVRPMIMLLYNGADCVVAVSEEVKDELESIFKVKPDKLEVITNGFGVSEIQNKMRADINDELSLCMQNKFVYVTIGRYCEAKAKWHLIRAFSKVASECGDAILLVVGQGEDKEYLESLIKENSLQNKVYLIPYQKNPFALLEKCDVFVMPSLFEGYCNALCEALICGLPCIATDFQSSAREILAPNTPYGRHMQEGVEYAEFGVLTPVCSGTRYKGREPLEKAEQYLAEAMTTLYKDSGLLERYRKKAMERGQQMDIGQKVQEWLNLVR